MKRQGCLFLILIFLINLQAKTSVLAVAGEEYKPTKFTINSFSNDFIVLPSVEKEGLAYFKARIEGEAVYLDWGIEGDFNTSSFMVQRKTLGNNFWTIGGISERGERNNYREHSFKDELETSAAPYRQYRLKQIFEDGSFIYHTTITILTLPSEKIEIQQGSVTDEINIVLPVTESPNYEVSILNISGRLLDSHSIPSIPTTQTLQTIDLSKFLPGMLILVIKAGEDRWTEKIIKY